MVTALDDFHDNKKSLKSGHSRVMESSITLLLYRLKERQKAKNDRL